MIKVEVCSHCKTQACDLGKGVDIFEEFKQYEELLSEKEIELDIKECSCLGHCKGPVVRVNGEIYTEVDSDKVEAILNQMIK